MSMHPIVRRTLTVTASLAALVAVATPASAQKSRGRNVHVKGASPAHAGASQDSVRGAEAYLYALRLADYGRQARSPLALASAAQIMLDVGTRPLAAQPTRRAGATNPQPKSTTAPSVAPESLLAEARTLAEGNASAIALIDQLSSRAQSGSRGNVNGPQTTVDRVLAHATDNWRLTFAGGEEAYVSVRGDGDTDLDCRVYDEYNNLITSDTDNTDYCILRWNPRWTGPFRLEIKNYGDVYNQYRITTN